MTDIQKAMLGDREAQERVTERGELLPCPFCGNDSVVHVVEAQPRYAEYKKEVPNGARIVRCMCYPSGKKYYEYRAKEYIAQCVDSSCCGRGKKRHKTMDEAVRAYNTRPALLTPEQIKRLEEVI